MPSHYKINGDKVKHNGKKNGKKNGMSPAQKKIAGMTPPFNKITGSDFKALRKKGNWNKEDLIKLFFEVVPEFHHKDTGKYLDQRM